MEILLNSDERRVEEHSSIHQFSHFLAVHKQGEYVPISFDILETARCAEIKSHRAILTDDKRWNGYFYPVATCTKHSQDVVFGDHQGVGERPLPPCQGKGNYLTFVNENQAVHDKVEFLGVKNKVRYRVGLNYYLAKETLPAKD